MNMTHSATRRGKGAEISLHLPPIGVLTGLFASSVGYAFLLTTEEGRRWDKKHTWFMTVIGVALTLAWLAMVDPKAAFKALVCFMVSGTPIVFRALFLENEQTDSLINRSVQ